jgi:hypothetical protein
LRAQHGGITADGSRAIDGAGVVRVDRAGDGLAHARLHHVGLHGAERRPEGHTDKPLLYKAAGNWGNHEGSMLLWVFILSVCSAAVAVFSDILPADLRARVLAAQGTISSGFLLFILLTSNPFQRVPIRPANCDGLKLVLQDPGLAFRPPFLYLGYVGFSVSFCFALAAVIEGRVDSACARWVRRWALASWCALTVGIAMGSWWAYYTFGWLGWWYWDPVENASFPPWLVGAALIHSSIVVERRDTLKSWTILLAIITFLLSLVGTFLVRSGVLSSVHAFAVDHARGMFILALLVVVIGGSLTLYAVWAPPLHGGGLFAPISREGALVLNNLLLTTSAATVLLAFSEQNCIPRPRGDGSRAATHLVKSGLAVTGWRRRSFVSSSSSWSATSPASSIRSRSSRRSVARRIISARSVAASSSSSLLTIRSLFRSPG